MGSNTSVPTSEKTGETSTVGRVALETAEDEVIAQNATNVTKSQKDFPMDRDEKAKLPPSGCPMHEANAQYKSPPSGCPMHEANAQYKSPPSGCPMHEENAGKTEIIDPTNMVYFLFLLYIYIIYYLLSSDVIFYGCYIISTSQLSISRTVKGPTNLFETSRIRLIE